MNSNLKPKKRSKVRLALGRIYYTSARYCMWQFSSLKFAYTFAEQPLSYAIFAHQSPLLRKLKDVDMQYQYNKIINLNLAVKQINNIIIKPKETFSYWKLIGKPTYKKGYQDGMVLFCGAFGPGVGGGLCQLSNLLYWMSLHTPLTITERYRHSFDVFPDSNRTVPFGSGATCVYPYRDLMITNNTSHTFQLKVWLDQEYLHGEWRCTHPIDTSYKVIEKNHRMEGEYWGGYSRHNEIFREIYNSKGEKIDEEYVTENHALMMYSPFLEPPK